MVKPPTSDYAKEPVIILDSTPAFSVGDKVKLNTFYLEKYVGLGELATAEAEIMKITSRASGDAVVCLFIKFAEDTRLFMVSPVGCDKV